MSEKVDEVILVDILQSIEQILTYTENESYESFINDRRTMDAVLMHIVVIGESVNRLSEEFKDHHEKIDWFKIKGMRNKIAHDYLNVDYELAWGVIQSKLPELKIYIEKILNN